MNSIITTIVVIEKTDVTRPCSNFILHTSSNDKSNYNVLTTF